MDLCLVMTYIRYTLNSLLLNKLIKSLILVNFLTFENFDLNLNYCLNSVLNPLFIGLFVN